MTYTFQHSTLNVTYKIVAQSLSVSDELLLSDLCSTGEVTPGLSQTEYEFRRHRLASLLEAQADRLGPSASSGNHVVIVLSHPTRYMTNDIPYPFHQNQVWVQFNRFVLLGC